MVLNIVNGGFAGSANTSKTNNGSKVYFMYISGGISELSTLPSPKPPAQCKLASRAGYNMQTLEL